MRTQRPGPGSDLGPGVRRRTTGCLQTAAIASRDKLGGSNSICAELSVWPELWTLGDLAGGLYTLDTIDGALERAPAG